MAPRKPGTPGALARSVQALFFAFAFFLLGRASFNLRGVAESSGIAALSPLYFLAGSSSSPTPPQAEPLDLKGPPSEQGCVSGSDAGRASLGAFTLQCPGSDRLRRLQELAEDSFNENYRRRQERMHRSVAAIEESKATGVSTLPGAGVSGLVKEMLAKAPGASQILTFVQQHPEFAEFRELSDCPTLLLPAPGAPGRLRRRLLGVPGPVRAGEQPGREAAGGVGREGRRSAELPAEGEASFEADAFSLLRADVHVFELRPHGGRRGRAGGLRFCHPTTVDVENPKAILTAMQKLRTSTLGAVRGGHWCRCFWHGPSGLPAAGLRRVRGPDRERAGEVCDAGGAPVRAGHSKQHGTFQNANRSRLIFALEALGYRLFHIDEDPFNVGNIHLSSSTSPSSSPRWALTAWRTSTCPGPGCPGLRSRACPTCCSGAEEGTTGPTRATWSKERRL